MSQADGTSRATSRGRAPRVTVVTAVFNAVETIEATLASVASQSVSDLEHLVIDGGSTDGTLAIIRAAGPRVRLVSDRDHGIYDAFNRGLALARGEWIHLLNADDAYAHDEVVARVLEESARDPSAGIIHADLDCVDQAGQVVRRLRFAPGDEALNFALEMPVNHPTVFVARRVYAALGGFDATFRLAGDYDYLLRAHLAGVRLRHVPDVFIRMRVGGRSEQQMLSRLETMRSYLHRTGRLPWRQLVRFIKSHVLDDYVPTTSAALGALKRALLPAAPSLRRDPGS